jgi:hypothetical protein
MIFLQITPKTTIMKTKKFFMLLAAVLLSASTFAQSGNNEPLKGDVNEDGTVDVADMVSIIRIMKDGGGAVGEKQVYWYAGTNNGNAVTADNFIDVATKIGESEIPATGSVTADEKYIYLVMPESWHLESLTDEESSDVEFTCTDVMGYHIYSTAELINSKIDFTIVENVYYWYVGQTDPSTMTEISGTADYNNGGGWTSTGNSVPQTIRQQVKGFDSTKEIFVAVPITSGTTLTPVASDMSTTDTSVHKVSTKTLNGVNYQIYTYGTGLHRTTVMFAKK